MVNNTILILCVGDVGVVMGVVPAVSARLLSAHN